MSGLLVFHGIFMQPKAALWASEMVPIIEQQDSKAFYKGVVNAERQWSTINYGLTFLFFGLLLFFIQRKGLNNLRNPDSPAKIVLVALAATAFSLLAYYLTQQLKTHLHLQPPWKDYTSEFEQDLRQLLIFYGLWVVVHLTAFAGPFNYRYRFFDINLSYINVFYLTTTMLSAGFSIVCFIGGEVLYFVASLIWLYFHLSILAGKRSSIPMEKV